MSHCISIRSTSIDLQRELLGATLICEHSLPPVVWITYWGLSTVPSTMVNKTEYVADRTFMAAKQRTRVYNTKKGSVKCSCCLPLEMYQPWEPQEPIKLFLAFYTIWAQNQKPHTCPSDPSPYKWRMSQIPALPSTSWNSISSQPVVCLTYRSKQ